LGLPGGRRFAAIDPVILAKAGTTLQRPPGQKAKRPASSPNEAGLGAKCAEEWLIRRGG
jgi:hypothetical protein